MGFKTILAVVQGPTDIERVLDCAIPLAERLAGHVIGAHAEPMPVAYATTVGFADTVFVESQIAANRERSGELARRFDARMSSANLPKDWRSIENYTGDSALSALNSARSADLIVAAQVNPDEAAATSAELDTLLFDAGRPMLLVPHSGPVLNRFGRITIAWNGTRESARATFDALPFIKEAGNAEVLLVDPPERGRNDRAADGRDIAATLGRHGINTTIVSKASASGESIGAAIQSHVVATGTDLLVMGAYGHSRLREWLFGGVTRTALKSMPLATLMAR